MSQEQNFKRENAIETSSKQGIDYTMDFIWGSDQDQYLREEAEPQTEAAGQDQEPEL